MGRKKKVIESPSQESEEKIIDQAKQKPDPIPSPSPEQIPVEITSAESVKSKLQGIGKIVNENLDQEFVKGTEIEELIKKASLPPSPASPSPSPSPSPTIRIGRGRHPKGCTCEKCIKKNGIPDSIQVKNGELPDPVAPDTLPTSAKFDAIAMMVNSTLVPIVSGKYNKDVKQVMLQDEQIDHLLTIKPESRMDRPSWVNYTLTAVSMLIMNFMTADSNDDKNTKTLNESLKLFSKMNAADQEIYMETLISKQKNDSK